MTCAQWTVAVRENLPGLPRPLSELILYFVLTECQVLLCCSCAAGVSVERFHIWGHEVWLNYLSSTIDFYDSHLGHQTIDIASHVSLADQCFPSGHQSYLEDCRDELIRLTANHSKRCWKWILQNRDQVKGKLEVCID